MSRPVRPDPTYVATSAHVEQLLQAIAAKQSADGTFADEDTWVWVQAFADFDYEYSYLLDVRCASKDGTVSDYLAVFKGYDRHGISVFRATWWGHEATFPKVPDLYDALAWWAGWTKETRQIEHGLNDSGESTEGTVD